MSNAVLKGNASGTGTVTLETPNTNTDRTISIPDATGTVMVSGNMPAFSAYLNASQTISSGTDTVVQNNVKIFDTATAYNNTGSTVTLNGISVPAYSFAPPVAGYYQVTMATNGPGSALGQTAVNLYKSGSKYQQGSALPNATFGINVIGSYLVYLNGTTDYITMTALQSTGGSAAIFGANGGVYTYFTAALVRGA